MKLFLPTLPYRVISIRTFFITHVFDSRILGHFMKERCYPDYFEAMHVVSHDGSYRDVEQKELEFFHFESVDKMVVFNQFRLPADVRPLRILNERVCFC